MQIPAAEKRRLQKEILSWYTGHKRDLPWRKTRDPYRILISEIMLQQTQVARVTPKYQAWLQAFPTVEALASAKTSDVLRLWSGLGYNRRALNLQKAALVISKEYKGIWSKEIRELKKLPGIGEYTARAILCFAFDEQVAVVDTNVRKVIVTKVVKGTLAPKEIQEIADQLLPKGKAYEWNQALMDYSAAMLKKEKISIPKQSRFIGSNRYYRGKIIKALLEISIMKRGELQKLVGLENKEALFTQLLLDLTKEGFIRMKEDTVHLG